MLNLRMIRLKEDSIDHASFIAAALPGGRVPCCVLATVVQQTDYDNDYQKDQYDSCVRLAIHNGLKVPYTLC